MKLKRSSMASPPKVTPSERNNLDKFIKMLSSKTVQVIVQSRLGEKIKMKSKPQSANADSFNLTIEDNSEIAIEARRAFPSLVPTVNVPMCVEISLQRTMEGGTLIAEVWKLEMLEQCEASAQVAITVYNRIGQMLKSLLAICRVLPCYHYSCRQTAKEYVVCYRVYMGEPDLTGLGDGQLSAEVGRVTTPVGTLALSVDYRVKMEMPSTSVSAKSSPFMVKSDHFKPDLSPKRQRHQVHQLNYANGFDPERQELSPNNMPNLVEELAAAASEEYQDGRFPFGDTPRNYGHATTNGAETKAARRHPIVPGERLVSPPNAYEKLVANRDWRKFGAFAHHDVKLTDEDVAKLFVPDVSFSALLRPNSPDLPESEETAWNVVANKNCVNAAANVANNNARNANFKPAADDLDTCSVTSDNCSQKSGCSAPDDFVLVELKTPFGQPDRATDLGDFFRECQSAPPLLSFSDQPSLSEHVAELNEQLAKFEVSRHDFDDFVDSLCHDESSK